MDLVSILFVICWGFSLILFFLIGFVTSTALAAKAKAATVGAVKETVFNIIKEVKKNERITENVSSTASAP